MKHWLRCRIVPGQFPSEYAVSSQQANGRTFSLFVSKGLVQLDSEPSLEEPGEGLLQVDVWSQKGDQAVVRLPNPSLESGQFVTVDENQLVLQEMVSKG